MMEDVLYRLYSETGGKGGWVFLPPEWPQMNADERRLKNKNLHSSNPRLSVFIRGQEAFSATC